MKFGHLNYLLKITVLAAFYFAGAKAALLFSFGEDYVSLVWFPAGMSLAALILFGVRLWPGLLLGACLAAISSGAPLAVVVTTAIGALLQALAALYFLQWAGFDKSLGRIHDILSLIFWGAFLSTTLSATIGVAGLGLTGLIPWTTYGLMWWQWWLGNVVGVLILTPALLAGVQWALRQPITEPVFFPLASSLLGLAFIASLIIWHLEEQTLHQKLQDDADETIREVEFIVKRNVQHLVAIEGLFTSSQQVERSEFDAFAGLLLSHLPAAQALGWIPYVPQAERTTYEEIARQDGFLDFQFTEQDAEGRLVPAAGRAAYFPVYYLEPYDSNKPALGFDLGSDPARLAALVRARDTGQPVATALVTLGQRSSQQKRFLVFVPVYHNDHGPLVSAETRRANVQGFVLGVFRVDDLVAETLNVHLAHGLEFFLFDTTASDEVQFLTSTACPSTSPAAAESGLPTPAALETGRYSYSTLLKINGRVWQAVARPCPTYLASGHSWGAWSALFIGMILSGTIIAYVGIRQRTEATLRRSEARYRAIVEDQTELICRSTPDQKLSFVNEAYCRFFGRSFEALVGKNLLHFISPENREVVRNRLTNLTLEKPVDSGEEQELRVDGSLRWLHWIDRAVFDEAGQLIEIQSVGQDVTDRKQLEMQLLQSQKMEAVGRLAGGIAHDFNNILVPIIGYAELGMMELSADDKLFTHLKRIGEAAERAAGLTRQILAFSRKQMLKMQALDLNATITDFQKMTQRLIGEDIESHIFLEPALYQINADKGQIEQVLMNLVVNARDAMPKGGTLTIETANVHLDDAYISKYVDQLLPGPYVMMAVSDTGHGMDVQTRQKIFEPFFTTKAQGKGTGLGLSTVFGIVKQHGGHIWVYSEPDKGTTFKIYLPKAEDDLQPLEPPLIEPVSPYGVETILVVEDEEIVRKLVCETLAAHGYQILEAQSSYDGLHLAATRHPIHLLLTDVVMPEMNGVELYQKVTAIQSDIKVLYMSGYTNNVIVHRGIVDGETGLLSKPFTVQGLTQKVRQVLG